MKSIDQLLKELSADATHIISSPDTIQQLMDKGVQFDKVKPKSNEEIIEELFGKRKTNALKVISKFPDPPNIAIPTVVSLYDEIRECIIFGLNGAAISLSAVLVEFSLKHAIIRHKKGKDYDKQEWDRLENKELGPTIQEAKELKIINASWAEKLNSFRENIRNPYLHYNIKKITKNVVARKVKRVDVNTGQVTEEDLPAKDNPITWVLAKKFVDRERVFKIFNFTDSLVKYLFC